MPWLPTAALALLVGYPLLVLAHELGHAFVVLAYGRSAEAAAGDGRHGVRFALGRLTVFVGPLARGGYCSYESSGLTIRQRRNVLIGGPVASICVACALGAAAFLTADAGSPPFWILAAGALVAAVQGLAAAWPRKRSTRRRNDGAQLRRLRSFEPHYVPARREGERAICRFGPRS